MQSNTFDQNLEAGHTSEEYVLGLIRCKYPDAHRVAGHFKQYDIYVPDVGGIEVKQDYKSKHTGNFVVEIEFNGKPSALMTTGAYMWVLVTMDEVAFIKPDRIKDCILFNDLNVASFVAKGDTKMKRAYLVKRDLLFGYAEKIISRGDIAYAERLS